MASKSFLSITLFSALWAGLTACQTATEETPEVKVQLRVMETTDLHMYLANYDYFNQTQSETIGLVNTASLIKQARSEVKNSVLVDNGDLIQNSPLGDYEAIQRRQQILAGERHVVFKAMNLLDYDVANIGNHEFNFGLPFLDASLKGANFPYINANVYIDDKDNNDHNDVNRFKPYVIQTKQVTDEQGQQHSLKIGYLGLTPPQIMLWDKAHLEGKVIAKDMVTTAKQFVPEMKAQGADIIILIPHSGLTASAYEDLAENTALYLSKIEHVDAILFGHSHRVFPGDPAYDGYEQAGIDNKNGKLNGVAAVMPGFFGNHLGLVDFTLSKNSNNDWTVLDAQVSTRAIFKGNKRDGSFVDLAQADSQIQAAIAKEHQATIDWISQPFANIAAPIYSYFSLVQDDPSIQLVADAQIDWGKRFIQGTELDGLPVLSAAAPFRAGRNGVDDYTYVATGELALLDTVNLYIYPNTIRMVKITGNDVKQWLERSAGQFNQIDPNSTEQQALLNLRFPSFDFDVIDGVSYQIDVTQPARYDLEGKLINPEFERIVNLQYQGKPIEDNAEFLIVTNNYRASGGGKFPNIDGVSRETFSGPDENRTVLRSYLIKQSKLAGSKGIDPSADNNWSFKKIDTDTKLNVVFATSSLDKVASIAETLPKVMPSTPLKIDQDGFALYQVNLQ